MRGDSKSYENSDKSNLNNQFNQSVAVAMGKNLCWSGMSQDEAVD
jgi:hypothetical protein